MIRLLLALLVVGALGHFVRWLFARRLRNSGNTSASSGIGAGSVPGSAVRRLVTSAARSILVGGAVVLVLFVGKLIYFEITRPAPATSGAVDTADA